MLNPPRLVLITGVGGAGKASLVEGLANGKTKVPGLKNLLICEIINKDKIGDGYTKSRGKSYIRNFRQRVYEQLFNEAEKSLSQGKSVIIDASHRFEITNPGWERRYRELAERCGALLKVIRLIVEKKTLKQRIQNRNSPYDKEKLTSAGWRAFLKEEPIEIGTLPPDCSLAIKNNHNFSQTVKQAMEFIKEI